MGVMVGIRTGALALVGLSADTSLTQTPRYVIALMPMRCHFGLRAQDFTTEVFTQPNPPSNDARASFACIGFMLKSMTIYPISRKSSTL